MDTKSTCAKILEVIGNTENAVQAFIDKAKDYQRLLEEAAPERRQPAGCADSESETVRPKERPSVGYRLHCDRPPLAAIIKASEDFPQLDFLLWWDDPARNQGGMVVFTNAEVRVVLQHECCEYFYREDDPTTDREDPEGSARVIPLRPGLKNPRPDTTVPCPPAAPKPAFTTKTEG